MSAYKCFSHPNKIPLNFIAANDAIHEPCQRSISQISFVHSQHHTEIHLLLNWIYWFNPVSVLHMSLQPAQLQWYVQNFDLIWSWFLTPHTSVRFRLWALKTIWNKGSRMLGHHEKVRHVTHQLVVAIVTCRDYNNFKVGRTALQLMQVWQIGK